LTLGTLMMFFADGRSTWVFAAMFIAGSAFDGFMAIHNAAMSEVGSAYPTMTGTAIGFTLMVRNTGGTFAPPLGNSLTGITLAMPFLLWFGMGLMALLLALVYREQVG
jgi:hypothetical protein